uniref:Uncharacterized protein n=1 Tax=Gossypium raimondii TaxID=29730 RepID=A0A0D2RAH8_GOSRA|nr:hypothetical protein B456_002G217100 [Gossypium raimondii]
MGSAPIRTKSLFAILLKNSYLNLFYRNRLCQIDLSISRKTFPLPFEDFLLTILEALPCNSFAAITTSNSLSNELKFYFMNIGIQTSNFFLS